MAFPEKFEKKEKKDKKPSYDEKLDKSVEKHGKFPPKKKEEEHPGVDLDEVYEAATPEERAMIEAICERIDQKEQAPPELPPVL
jgi:hypothetical protein